MLGKADLLNVMRAGGVEVHGAPRYRKALPSWIGMTKFAGMAREHGEHRGHGHTVIA